MTDGILKPKNKPQINLYDQSNQNIEQMSMTGKTQEEMLPYLLSGEPDDLSVDFIKE